MQPVLGLVKDRGVRPVDDRFGDFHAAPGGKAVHDDCITSRYGKQFLVQLKIQMKLFQSMLMERHQ